MTKLNYREIMDSVKSEGKKLTSSHIKVIRKSLDESDLGVEQKNAEITKIDKLQVSE